MSISKEKIDEVVTNYVNNLNDLGFDEIKGAFGSTLSCEEIGQLDKSDINLFIDIFVKHTHEEMREMLSGSIGYYQNEFKEEAGCGHTETGDFDI